MNFIQPATQRFLIALIVLALFGGSVIVMSFIILPEANIEVVIQLVGGINTLAGLVIGYYFGSSSRRDESPAQVEVVNPTSALVPTENVEPGQ